MQAISSRTAVFHLTSSTCHRVGIYCAKRKARILTLKTLFYQWVQRYSVGKSRLSRCERYFRKKHFEKNGGSTVKYAEASRYSISRPISTHLITPRVKIAERLFSAVSLLRSVNWFSMRIIISRNFWEENKECRRRRRHWNNNCAFRSMTTTVAMTLKCFHAINEPLSWTTEVSSCVRDRQSERILCMRTFEIIYNDWVSIKIKKFYVLPRNGVFH